MFEYSRACTTVHSQLCCIATTKSLKYSQSLTAVFCIRYHNLKLSYTDLLTRIVFMCIELIEISLFYRVTIDINQAHIVLNLISSVMSLTSDLILFKIIISRRVRLAFSHTNSLIFLTLSNLISLKDVIVE